MVTLQCVPALDVKALLRRVPRPLTLTHVLLTYVLEMLDGSIPVVLTPRNVFVRPSAQAFTKKSITWPRRSRSRSATEVTWLVGWLVGWLVEPPPAFGPAPQREAKSKSKCN